MIELLIALAATPFIVWFYAKYGYRKEDHD